MIQFNLLPDIKIQYLKAKHQQQLVMLASGITVVVSLVVLVLLIVVVFGLQKKSIHDLNADITTKSNQLQGTPNLSKILTVQNQLNSLPTLHNNKAAANRLFNDLEQLTPTAASIANLNADFVQHTMLVTGGADTLHTVTVFADDFKYATYHTAKAPNAEKNAFSSVVLTSYARDSKGATYSITLGFDPILFDETANVTLTVPKVPDVNTHSAAGQTATDLFKKTDTGQ